MAQSILPAPSDAMREIEDIADHFESNFLTDWVHNTIIMLRALDTLPPHVRRQHGLRLVAIAHESGLLYLARCLDTIIHRPTSFGFFPQQVSCFFVRARTLFCHPSQFATVFLDFCSLLYSFWDGGRTAGPNFILPMSSLMQRPSGRLSRLLLHYARDHSQDEFRITEISPPENLPQVVAVIDLNEVPQSIIQGNYSTGADYCGLTSLLILVGMLNWLIAPSFLVFIFFLPKSLMSCVFAAMLGDGTLSLVQRSEGFCTPPLAYAILLDEEFYVVLRGSRDVVEAVTLSGFHLSHQVSDLLPWSIWKPLASLVLEGFFQGLFYLMAFIPVFRFMDPGPLYLTTSIRWLTDSVLSYSRTLIPAFRFIDPGPLFTTSVMQILIPSILAQFLAFITSVPTYLRISWIWISYLQTVWPWMGNDRPITVEFLGEVLAASAEGIAETIRSISRVAPVFVCWYLYIHEYGANNELQLLLDGLPILATLFIFSVSSQNYPVRTAKFLDVLGNPPVRKWNFSTVAAAATFQCLVLCHGIPRPVKDVDVRGVLDTLIPDQRDVWRTWKARVADRIVHEPADISFAPTLPTFRAAERQKQLKKHLDEAQFAYKTYHHFYFTHTESSE